MLMLDSKTILGQLSFKVLVEELRAMHLEPIGQMKDLLVASPGKGESTNHFFIRTGWQPEKAVGAKVTTIFPSNNQRKIHPSIQAVYILFDGKNGTPVACLDGTALTYLKTATDSALGCDFLARQSIESMLMIGAGEMSKHLVMAHCQVRPSIRHVYVWNRTPEKALKLCEGALAKKLPHIRFEVVSDLSQYVPMADLICSATATFEPILKGKWIQPGTHVDLIGAYTPEMREADDECLRKSSIFVDARETTIGEIGELMIPISNGVIGADDVKADFSDLCQDLHSGRTGDKEITLFKNGGGGHLDLMMSRILVEHYKNCVH